MFTKTLVGLSTLGLLAACGGGGGSSNVSGAEKPYVDAVITSIEQDETMPLTDDEVECLATEMVGVIGVDGFEKAGLSPDDIASGADLGDAGVLSDGQASELVDVFFSGDCFDFVDLLAQSFMSEEGGGLNEEQARCVGEKFVENDAFKDAFVASLTGNQEVDPNAAVGDVFEIFAACDISLSDLGS